MSIILRATGRPQHPDEYHPRLKLSNFRRTTQAQRKLATIERRAARYG